MERDRLQTFTTQSPTNKIYGRPWKVAPNWLQAAKATNRAILLWAGQTRSKAQQAQPSRICVLGTHLQYFNGDIVIKLVVWPRSVVPEENTLLTITGSDRKVTPCFETPKRDTWRGVGGGTVYLSPFLKTASSLAPPRRCTSHYLFVRSLFQFVIDKRPEEKNITTSDGLGI